MKNFFRKLMAALRPRKRILITYKSGQQHTVRAKSFKIKRNGGVYIPESTGK